MYFHITLLNVRYIRHLVRSLFLIVYHYIEDVPVDRDAEEEIPCFLLDRQDLLMRLRTHILGLYAFMIADGKLCEVRGIRFIRTALNALLVPYSPPISE